MVDAFVTPLTQEDIADDKSWLDRSVLLVTGNLDRTVLNACMANVLSRRARQLLFRWRKPLVDEVPCAVKELVYREDERPELFGSVLQGKYLITPMGT